MENTFNLREFFISILKKWKLVLILTFVVAILAGGYKASSLLKRKNDLKNQNAINENQDESDKEDIYQNELSIISNNILKLEKEILSTSEYRENSIYYNLDPYNTAVSRLNIYIKTDIDKNISDGYKNILNSDELYQEINTKTKIEKKYIKELLDVEETIVKSSMVVYTSDYKSNFLTFLVYHYDEKTAENIMKIIEQFLTKESKEYYSDFGSHTISIINKSTATEFVEENLLNQSMQNDYYTSLKEKMILENINLKGLKKPQNTNISFFYILKQTVFFAVLGGVVGLVLSILVVFLIYLISDNILIQKLLDKKEIKNMGYLINENKKTSKIENFILKLEGYNLKNLTFDRSKELIKNNFDYFLKNEKITLISSDEKINLKDVAKDLNTDYLKNSSINPDLTEHIKENKNLILVESFKMASRNDLENIVNQIEKYDYKISGYILVK